MEAILTLHPAKRILVLYAILFLMTLGLLIIGLQYLSAGSGMERVNGSMIWKAAIFMGLPLLGYAALWRITSVYAITSESVSATIGILSKHHIRIPMNRIVDYRIVRPILERILGLGSIYIDTAGDDDLMMQQISTEEIELAVQILNKLLNKEQRRADTVSKAVT